MASSYTSSYQLCQWEGTDKVLRTDFNGDNAKIDAALKANADAIAAKAAQADLEEVAADLAAETAAREAAVSSEASTRAAADTALEARFNLQLLHSTTLSAQAGQLQEDLTGIDWSKWACLHWILKPVQTTSGFSVSLNFNATYNVTDQGGRPYHLILWPMGIKTMPVSLISFSGDG